MAFFRNDTINLLNLHYGIHFLALSGGGAFFAAFLLHAGVPAPAVLASLPAIRRGADDTRTPDRVRCHGGRDAACRACAGGFGARPLKRMGCAANAASRVMARCSVSAAAVPSWTAAGAIKPIPPWRCL